MGGSQQCVLAPAGGDSRKSEGVTERKISNRVVKDRHAAKLCLYNHCCHVSFPFPSVMSCTLCTMCPLTVTLPTEKSSQLSQQFQLFNELLAQKFVRKLTAWDIRGPHYHVGTLLSGVQSPKHAETHHLCCSVVHFLFACTKDNANMKLSQCSCHSVVLVVLLAHGVLIDATQVIEEESQPVEAGTQVQTFFFLLLFVCATVVAVSVLLPILLLLWSFFFLVAMVTVATVLVVAEALARRTLRVIMRTTT